jgi:hypothetical protein
MGRVTTDRNALLDAARSGTEEALDDVAGRVREGVCANLRRSAYRHGEDGTRTKKNDLQARK